MAQVTASAPPLSDHSPFGESAKVEPCSDTKLKDGRCAHKKETTHLYYSFQRDHYNIYRFYSTHKSFIQIGITNSLLDNFMLLYNLDIFMLLFNLGNFMLLSNKGLTNPLFRHYSNSSP